MTVVVEASRPGPCDSCEYGIRLGHRIQPAGDGKWEHVSCPTARRVCPECFVEVSVSGACVCGAI